MKTLLIAILYLFFPSEETKYIKSTIDNGDFIIINFYDSTSLKCDIKKENIKRYFLLNNDKIYLDVDVQAKWKQNIDSLFKTNTIRPQLNYGEPLPMMYLIFIINKDGKIVYKGFNIELPLDNYQKEFFRLMTLVDGTLEPAIVNGKKVASILKLRIDYYGLFDDKIKR